MEDLQSSVDAKEMAVHTYTNVSEARFSGGAGNPVSTMFQLSNISFVSKSPAISMVMVTATFEMDSEGEVEFYQLFDDSVMLGSPVAHSGLAGRHTITFVNYFSTNADSVHRYIIRGASKSLAGEAKTPTILIKPYDLKVIIFGQGLSATAPWDGIIRANDEITVISVDTKKVSANSVSENVSSTLHQYNPNSISDEVYDEIGAIRVNNKVVNVVGVSDEVTLSTE